MNLTSLTKDLSKTLVAIPLAIASFSMAGSLYFSEYDGYIPCDLCWWQRVAIYPLVPIFAIALAKNDRKVYATAAPFLIFGTLVSLYHNIIYYRANFFQAGSYIAPCRVNGASCTARYIEFFGFVSIPLLSLLALLTMSAAMIWLWKREGKKQA